jgi:tRNA 2-selenouridine synthase
MLLPIILSNENEKKFMLLKGYKAFLIMYNFLSNPFYLKISVDIPVLVKLKPHSLKKERQQVIDLEGLANHRGSAFGEDLQPTTNLKTICFP